MASILRVDTLTDASSNNSTAMSTVFNGTGKSYAATNSDFSALVGSFNVSSLTDVESGKSTITFSSNMNNTQYTVTHGNGTGGNNGNRYWLLNNTIATNSYQTWARNSADSAYTDSPIASVTHGDLA